MCFLCRAAGALLYVWTMLCATIVRLTEVATAGLLVPPFNIGQLSSIVCLCGCVRVIFWFVCYSSVCLLAYLLVRSSVCLALRFATKATCGCDDASLEWISFPLSCIKAVVQADDDPLALTLTAKVSNAHLWYVHVQIKTDAYSLTLCSTCC